MIAIIILFLVFILIAVRQVGNLRLKIWWIMLFGAAAVLLFGEISFLNALEAVNIDVMVFLFCMFVIGQALDESGYLGHLSYKLFKRARTMNSLLIIILFGFGFLSTLLMNDTLAIIGVPVVLLLARKHGIRAKILLLALCFAVTIGSALSPIGNPQNLLIALHGNIKNPFVAFLKYLIIPTLINLLIAFFLFKIFYRNSFHDNELNHSEEPIKDKKLAVIARVSLMLVVALIIVKILLIFMNIELRLTYIALIAAMPVLLFSRKRFEIMKKVDWGTLIFFIAMFILMEAVWNTGFFQGIINGLDVNIASLGMIFLVSVLLSQLISNVPLVALYLPLLAAAGAGNREMIALAAGSTVAGNLFIFGAASNVIVIQNAEKHGETITFWEFARIGIPLTLLNVGVYWLFLWW